MNAQKTFRYLEGVTTLQFAQERCISCGRCIEVCPHGVFQWKNGTAVLQDRDACMECGACATNCPTAAIMVRAGVGCAYAVFASKWFGKLPWNKKSSDAATCCISVEESGASHSAPRSQPEASASQNSPCCVPIERSSQQSSCCAPVQKPTRNTPCCGGGGCCGS